MCITTADLIKLTAPTASCDNHTDWKTVKAEGLKWTDS